jgi:signal transduction histidine kinase/ligand-binding sensor domain-containing protein
VWRLAPLLVVLAAGKAHALDPGRPFEQVAHTAWPAVAHASGMHALGLGPSGALWIGTSDGLVRFDGEQMRGVAGGTANRVLETVDGTVWVGSFTAGLARGRGGTMTTVTEGVPAGRIQALMEDGDGAVWVGTSAGLVRFARGATRAVPAQAGLPSSCVHLLLRGRDGLWAGLHDGLARWDAAAGAWRRESGLPAGLVVDALGEDPDGELWLGSRQDGLWRRRQGTWEAAGAGLGSPHIRAILRDRAGHLWVATAHGLSVRAGSGFADYALPPALCGSQIKVLAEDAEGGLWLGTDGCGLHRLQDRRFRTYSAAEGLPPERILGIALGPDQTTWVGTLGGGVWRWRDGRPARLACPGDLPCGECWDFSAARQMWMVCSSNVVLRADGERVERVGPLPGQLPEASFAIAARDGSVWMALGRKVVRRDAAGRESLIAAQEPLQGVRILHQGRDGTIWIVAEDGVARWRQGETRIIRLPAAERPAEAANVIEDAEGALWIATKGEGLRRLAGGALTTVGVAAGLPSQWLVQPLEDGQGRLWVSSSKGIFWVDLPALRAAADGRQVRLRVTLYDATDGVPMGAESFGHPAGFRDPGGRLWFATSAGVASIDPATLGAPRPRVVLQEVRLGGQRVEPGAPLPAGPAPRDLEVTWSALSFAPRETLLFRYRLDGRDGEWTEAGAARGAHYGGLGAGHYRLLVEARHREGDWSLLPAAVAFTVRPPFFRSPQFLATCALGVALLLWAGHRVRLGQAQAGLRAVMVERARIARDFHDTLAQAFAATSVQLECLAEALDGGDRPRIQRHLETAQRVVEESLDEARRAVWVLRPQAIDQGLARALATLVERVSGGTPVTLTVTGPERPLSPLLASNLLRIAHEGVANARRHARAAHIQLGLAFGGRAVTLTVADDGKGFDLTDPTLRDGGGTGLMGMRERAADMGAALQVDSAPGQGTTVRVEAPL